MSGLHAELGNCTWPARHWVSSFSSDGLYFDLCSEQLEAECSEWNRAEDAEPGTMNGFDNEIQCDSLTMKWRFARDANAAT